MAESWYLQRRFQLPSECRELPSLNGPNSEHSRKGANVYSNNQVLAGFDPGIRQTKGTQTDRKNRAITKLLDIRQNNIKVVEINAIFPEAIYGVTPSSLEWSGNGRLAMNLEGASTRLADDARSRICEITPGELARFRKIPLIVDVREKDEFVRGHINGAKHISRGLLEQKVCEVAPQLFQSDRGVLRWRK